MRKKPGAGEVLANDARSPTTGPRELGTDDVFVVFGVEAQLTRNIPLKTPRVVAKRYKSVIGDVCWGWTAAILHTTSNNASENYADSSTECKKSGFL